MPLLNGADAIYLGNSPVDSVYAGDVLVWPPYDTINITGATGWSGYQGNINGPMNYAPGDLQLVILNGLRDTYADDTLDDFKNGRDSIPPEIKNWRLWRSSGDRRMRVYWGVTDGTKRLRIDLGNTGDALSINWLSVSGVDTGSPFGGHWQKDAYLTTRRRGVVPAPTIPVENAAIICTQWMAEYYTWNDMNRIPGEPLYWSGDDPPYSPGSSIRTVARQASTSFNNLNYRNGGMSTLAGYGSLDDPPGWLSFDWGTDNGLYGPVGVAFTLKPGRKF